MGRCAVDHAHAGGRFDGNAGYSLADVGDANDCYSLADVGDADDCHTDPAIIDGAAAYHGSADARSARLPAVGVGGSVGGLRGGLSG